MGLELVPRHQEKNDVVHRLFIQGFEIDALFGTGKAGGDFLDRIAAGMGDGNAKPDAGAHGFLTMTKGRNGLVVMRGIKMSLRNKAGDNLLKCLPTICGRQLRDNLILGE